MTKELVDSFRKGGLKYRLERDEDVWYVRTDRQLFYGSIGELDAFCEEQGLTFAIPEDKVAAEILEEALEVAEEVDVEAIIEALPDADEVEAETVLVPTFVEVEDVTDKEFPTEEEVLTQVEKDRAEIAALEAQIKELKKDG